MSISAIKQTPPASVTLTAAFLSDDRIAKIVANEEATKACIKMVLENAKRATDVFLKGELEKIDPLVGDHACERRALKIHALAISSVFKSEVQAFSKTVAALSVEAESAFSAKKSKGDSPVVKFFQEKVRCVPVSADLTYLLQAHFVAFAKTAKFDTKTGKIVRTFTGAEAETNDISKLEELTSRLTTGMKKALNLFSVVDGIKERLAAASLSFLQNEIDKSALLTQAESKALQEVVAGGKNVYRCYHTFKSVIARIREQQIVVLVKKMQPKPDEDEASKKQSKEFQPITAVYRAATPGGLLEPLSEAEVEKNRQLPAIVFEAAMLPTVTVESLKEKIAACGGFEAVVHANASLSDDPAAMPNEAARKEIEAAQSAAKKMGYTWSHNKEFTVTNPFLIFDHVYCNTVDREYVKGGKS